MILRRLSKHIKEQNWFAVGLDFFIVVAGILLAFQITNWSVQQQQKTTFVRAKMALQGDLIVNYLNAKERTVLNECRKLALRELGNELLQDTDAWEPALNVYPDRTAHAFHSVVRSPKRYWNDKIWETEVARGSFDLMDPDRRQQLDIIFKAVKAMGIFQRLTTETESQLTILGQAKQLNRAERFQLFQVVSQLDDQSVALEAISQNIVDSIEGLTLTLSSLELNSLHEKIVFLNTAALPVYGDCRVPITTPFLDNVDMGGTP
jgi:hypothetical protein